MKRILLLLSILFCLSAVTESNAQDDIPHGCPVNQPNGNQDKDDDNDHEQDPLDDTSTSGGISADPNEIIGPTGYDSVRWVSINDVLNYTIFFENDPDFATANAQKVDVRFNFTDKAAMKGFGLGTYGFANQSWDIEDAPAAYQNRLDLRDSMHIYVDLTAGIDVVKQQAFWLFNSIDPETGYNPWQVDRGMLPVNDSTHVGEGFVTFRLKPQEDLKTGDTISIVASIVFDQNDTIPTNRWRNTIDAGNPTSKVKARQDSKNEHLYHLTMEAADDEGGSGLKRVLLYQANNFGIYEEVATCPVDTVIEFTAEPGHQYRFYSIAEDNVGNREPLKEQPDLVININAAPTDIALSDSIFQDDIAAGGFIAELTSEDIEQDGTFTYALAEGDGAIHNDFFQVKGTQLLAKDCFKCAEDTIYKVRLSTTDEGGLSYSKAFSLNMKKVLEKPEIDTLNITICEGDVCDFHGKEYEKTGLYRYTKGNDYMCDSVFVLNLTVLPKQEKPTVTVEGTHTLVSSFTKGNQWYKDGEVIAEATEQKYTPEEDGIYYVMVSNGSCAVKSDSYQVKLSDYMDLELDLKTGWNWISSNLTEPTHQDAKQFIQPFEDAVSEFKSQTQGLYHDSQYGLVGNLKTIDPASGYKLKVTEDVNHIWSGNGASPETTAIHLKKGWNWIGYVPISTNGLEEALSPMEPAEEDIIKNMDNFAVYTGGEWVGTLTTMKPGEGYLFKSDKDVTFNYPMTRVFPVIEETSQAKSMASANASAPWQYEVHSYPDNMTLIGKLYANDIPMIEGSFTIGAFSGDECRGIGQYIKGYIFMTIHGTASEIETLSFKAYEKVSGHVFDAEESLSFNGNHIGSMQNPFIFNIYGATEITDVATSGKYVVYPRPLRNVMYIKGETEDIQTVHIISINGLVLMTQNGYNAEGINVAHLNTGTYIVAITTKNGGRYYEKIVKVN